MMGRAVKASLPSQTAITVPVHAALLLLALITLTLHARVLAFYTHAVLIYSLVLSAFTIIACAYAIASVFVFTKACNFRLGLVFSLLMSMLWTTNLGLMVGSKTHWMDPECMDESRHGHQCTKTGGLTLCSDDTNACNTLTRTLTASLVLAALEILFWVIATGLAIHGMRRRSSQTPPQPAQPTEFWDQYIHEPRRPGPQPLLPESDYNEGDSIYLPRFAITDHATADSLSPTGFDLRPQQSPLYYTADVKDPDIHQAIYKDLDVHLQGRMLK